VFTHQLDLAFAVLDLRLEPLQVWQAPADLGNVAPATAELHDGNRPTHEQREEGDDGRQAKRDPSRDDDRRHARSEDWGLSIILDGEENGCIARHIEAFAEDAERHLHLALHDRKESRLRLRAVLRKQAPAGSTTAAARRPPMETHLGDERGGESTASQEERLRR
jgi:hypothetical protein